MVIMRIVLSSERKREEMAEYLKTLPPEEDDILLRNDTVRRAVGSIIIIFAGIMTVLLAWTVIAWFHDTFLFRGMGFPAPVETFERLWSYLTGEDMYRMSIWDHALASAERWIIGYAIAALIGIFIGMALSSSSLVYSIGIIPVNVIQMIPGLAWIPVAFLLFGVGGNAAIFIIAISAISPVAINAAAGMRRVPEVNIKVAQMAGLSKMQIYDRILLPYAAADIVSGLRIGMGNAWRMLIAAEMVVGVGVGLGFVIEQSASMGFYIASFVSMIMICAIGLFLDKAVFARIEDHTKKKLGTEGT
jgi:ABC-type nitrate/sulfonate/bicarbonate transport system permease component